MVKAILKEILIHIKHIINYYSSANNEQLLLKFYLWNKKISQNKIVIVVALILV